MSKFKLRPHQGPTAEALLKRTDGRGIIEAPCGAGKTLIAAEAIRRAIDATPGGMPYGRVAWLCNTTEQRLQAEVAIEIVFNMLPNWFSACCAAGAELDGWDEVDILVVDECHHAAAPTWKAVIEACVNARYKWGFSATPVRDDEHADVVFELLGPVAHTVDRKALEANGNLLTATVLMVDQGPRADLMDAVIAESGFAPDEIAFDAPDWMKYKHWRALSKIGFSENKERNDCCVSGARYHIALGDSVLIVVSTVLQGMYFGGQIGLASEFVHSKIGKKRRKELVKDFSDGKLPCLIATSLAEEGLDVPRANVLFFASGGRSKRKAEQVTGRVLRTHAEKSSALIYDFVDSWHPWLLNQSKARVATYKRLGYEIKRKRALVARCATPPPPAAPLGVPCFHV